MIIIIDPEFQSQIPPQTPEENAALEQSILAEGCRDPLTVWGNILVDGHNRYELCTRHGIPYQTLNRDFADRDTAAAWIDENQISRRNLPPEQMSAIRARYYNRLKSGHGGDRKSKGHDVTLINAAEVTADKFGVTARTIRRDAAKAAGKVSPLKKSSLDPLLPVEQPNTITIPLPQYEEMASAKALLIASYAEIKSLTERIEELEKELANYKMPLTVIEEHQEALELMETLQSDCIDWQECAGKREFDGGMSRLEAEQAATEDLRNCYCWQGADFWESAVQDGVTVCRRCNPPVPGAEQINNDRRSYRQGE